MENTKLSTLKRMIESIEKNGSPQKDMDISFEFIVGSLFPDALNNMKELCTQKYIEGYNESLKIGTPQEKIKFKFIKTNLENAISSLESLQRVKELQEEDAMIAHDLANKLHLLIEPLE